MGEWPSSTLSILLDGPILENSRNLPVKVILLDTTAETRCRARFGT